MFANMANPYVNGTKNSLFISSKDVSVTKENIDIFLLKDIAEVAYTITYEIESDTNTVLPLLFIASNYEHDFKVIINGDNDEDTKVLKKITGTEIKEEFSYLKVLDNEHVDVPFSKTETVTARMDDLIAFNASLRKGKNTIEVAYFALNSYNRHDWFKKPTIEYSLYPSKFWKSFGTISIKIHSEQLFKIDSSNIGKPMLTFKQSYNNEYSWQLKKITTDVMSIQVSPKISLLSKILIALDPIGIAIIILIILIIFHFKRIKKYAQTSPDKINKPLWLGNILIPIIFIVVFLFSFSLIDWTLAESAGNFHGYIFMIILMLPFFWMGYSLFMWLIYRQIILRNNR